MSAAVDSLRLLESYNSLDTLQLKQQFSGNGFDNTLADILLETGPGGGSGSAAGYFGGSSSSSFSGSASGFFGGSSKSGGQGLGDLIGAALGGSTSAASNGFLSAPASSTVPAASTQTQGQILQLQQAWDYMEGRFQQALAGITETWDDESEDSPDYDSANGENQARNQRLSNTISFEVAQDGGLKIIGSAAVTEALEAEFQRSPALEQLAVSMIKQLRILELTALQENYRVAVNQDPDRAIIGWDARIKSLDDEKVTLRMANSNLSIHTASGSWDQPKNMGDVLFG